MVSGVTLWSTKRWIPESGVILRTGAQRLFHTQKQMNESRWKTRVSCGPDIGPMISCSTYFTLTTSFVRTPHSVAILWKQLVSISLSRRDLQVASERLRGLLNRLRRRIHGNLWLSHPRKCKTRWCQYVWLQAVMFVNATIFRIWLYRLTLQLHLRLAKARPHQIAYRNSSSLYRLVDKIKGKNRV